MENDKASSYISHPYKDELAAVSQRRVFLRLNVNVFTDVDNRARGRSRDNIGPKREH